jgi:hypothetical protein
MRTLPSDEQTRRLRSKNRALFAALLGLVILIFAITYVRMSEVEERRHETLTEPHRLSTEPHRLSPPAGTGTPAR